MILQIIFYSQLYAQIAKPNIFNVDPKIINASGGSYQSNNLSINWSFGEVFSTTFTASEKLIITVTVIANGNYVNTAIIYGNEPDSNMANNTSSIEVYPTEFFIPEGFSPNGDGINDVFVIRGISNFPKNNFEIFT